MNLFARCLLLGSVCVSGNALGAIVSSDVYGTAVSWGEDVVVADGVVIAPNQINITRSMRLENHGVLETDIVICDGCDLFVENTGQVATNFILGNGADVFHVITDVDTATPIDFGVGYTVVVDGVDGLTVGQVANASVGADKIVITDSVLRFDSGDVGTIDNVEVNGEIRLKTANLSDVYNRVIFRNVSVDGRVVFLAEETDNMYVDEGVIENSNLYIRRRRETDYAKIFDNDVGVFLNGLRSDSGAQGLMLKMDVATDMTGLKSVMAQSIRFNRDRLQDSVRQIFVFDDMAMVRKSDVAVAPFVIMSGDLFAYGIGANVVGRVSDDVSVGVAMRAGRLEYDDGLDTFLGRFYGGSIMGLYAGHDMFIREIISLNAVAFEVGDVMYDGVIYHNPDMLYGNNITDVGYVFNLSDDLYFAPYFGIDATLYTVADLKDIDVFVRGGVGAGYKFKMLGVQYEYGANLVVNTNGESVVMGRYGFWSEYDMAGGDIGIGLSYHDNGVAYKVSATARFLF